MNDYFLFKRNLIVVNYDEMGKKEEEKENEEKKERYTSSKNPSLVTCTLSVCLFYLIILF